MKDANPMRAPPQATLKELRLHWSHGLNDRGHGEWMPNNLANLELMQTFVEESCRIFSAGTHWIERRDA